MRARGGSRTRRARGHTLLELMVVVVALGVLAAFAVPKYRVAGEQLRVDAGAAALRTVWNAQRLHWLEARTYADDLETLRDEGLLGRTDLSGADSFAFAITSASATEFVATAVRTGGPWDGTLEIDATGEVTGDVADEGGVRIAPGVR